MKIQINNSIVETEDIREITRVKLDNVHLTNHDEGADIDYDAYMFQIKFYEGKGLTKTYELSKAEADAYPDRLLQLRGFNAQLILAWSNNQLEIPKFTLE